MQIKYIGRCKVQDIFNCEICGQRSKEKFEATPSTHLVDWDRLMCCKKCAQREVGSKNKKKLEAIMENVDDKKAYK